MRCTHRSNMGFVEYYSRLVGIVFYQRDHIKSLKIVRYLSVLIFLYYWRYLLDKIFEIPVYFMIIGNLVGLRNQKRNLKIISIGIVLEVLRILKIH